MARRPFFDTIRDVRGGAVVDELSEKLQELVQAVQQTNGAGRLTLVLDVKPLKGSTEALVIVDEIKLKKPERKREGAVMFPTVEGNLQRNNPAQRDLPGITLAADRAAAHN